MQLKYLKYLLILMSLNGWGQRQQHVCQGYYKCSYETNQGRIDGRYLSYYPNGKKRAEGKFENNYRIGKWSLWDSLGKIVMKRDYENQFVFKCLIPQALTYQPSGQYNLRYNKDGYIDNIHLKEEMIVWTTRLWRFIPAKNNQLLFEHNTLFQILQKSIFDKNITAYSVANDEFKNALPSNQIDTANFNIIGYKIKEDFFIDNERLVSETEIIGICPVAVNKINGDTIDLYWVYYPDLRKYLALEKIGNPTLPSKIKTFDDLFFFRYFSGIIYKQSNVYDRQISEYKKGKEIEREVERIEIGLIETEHDSWIDLAKTGNLTSEGSFRAIGAPGAIRISNNVYFDLGEVRNLDWHEFMYWVTTTYGSKSKEYNKILPDSTQWSKLKGNYSINDTFYLLHPAYRDYPLVGISFEQAQLFSKWRSDRVMEYILIKRGVIPDIDSRPKGSIFTIEKYFKGQFCDILPNPYLLFYPEYTLPDSTMFYKASAFADSLNQKNYGSCRNKICSEMLLVDCNCLENIENRSETRPYGPDPTKPTFCNSCKKDLITHLKGNVREMTSTKGVFYGDSFIDSCKQPFNQCRMDNTNLVNSYTGFRNVCSYKRWK